MDLVKIAAQFGISVDEVRSRWMILRTAKWMADFRLFCREAIRIRTKDGDLAPLILNEAQEILLAKAEEQLRTERWVRLAGLKGRRQGFCVSPDTRVLTADLRWVRIDDLPIGEEVFACDEKGEGKSGRGFSHRKMRRATIQAKADTYQEAYRLTFDDGSSVVCSGDHRWLCRSTADTLIWSSLNGEARISGYGSYKNRIRVGSIIRAVTDAPWIDPQFEDGWFGGILDGEGSLHARQGESVSLSVVQRENPAWWRMLTYVLQRKLEPAISVDARPGYYGNRGKQSSTPINVIELNKLKNIIQCIGQTRPSRFVDGNWWEGRKLPSDCSRTVVSIERLPKQRLVDIQTSTGTFIAEGLVSHNSTMVAARGYWRATLFSRQNIYILSHEMTASAKLFDMVALMQEKNPFPPQVGTDNAKELDFPKRGSTYSVATAGQKAGGRGAGISFFHGSEVAWWTNAADHFASSVQAVDEVRGQWGVLWTCPDRPLPFEAAAPATIEGWIKPPSEIWLETTSAGPVGVFYRRYMEAMKKIGRYTAAFVPWTVQQEYTETGDFSPSYDPQEEGELSEAEYQEMHGLTDGQMLWRQGKILELGSLGKFRQEYPIDVTEAFAADSTEGVYIKPALVLKARKRRIEMPDAPLIIGIDPAGGGGDRFAVAWRRGDLIYKIKGRVGIDHNEAVAWVSSIIDRDRPNRVCIDRGNIGGPLITALRSMNQHYFDVIRGIDFGGTSKAKLVNKNRAGPINRRAEIYDKFAEWLKEGGIPDDDDLASDISGPKKLYRANNDWLMESKKDMKARGLRSSDLSDACAITFSTEEFFDTWSRPKQEAGFGIGVMQHIVAPGVGDNDGFWEMTVPSGTSWMA